MDPELPIGRHEFQAVVPDGLERDVGPHDERVVGELRLVGLKFLLRLGLVWLRGRGYGNLLGSLRGHIATSGGLGKV